MKSKAVLFDRDGVLTIEPPRKRILSVDEVRIFHESISALSRIAHLDYLCFIVTNQGAFAEGTLDEKTFHAINSRLFELLASSDIRFEKLYYNTDLPRSNTPNQKPNTGMLNKLLSEYDIDVANSFMIGDRDSDIEFGKRGGLKTILIVREDNLSYSHENFSSPDFRAKDLNEVVDIIKSV